MPKHEAKAKVIGEEKAGKVDKIEETLVKVPLMAIVHTIALYAKHGDTNGKIAFTILPARITKERNGLKPKYRTKRKRLIKVEVANLLVPLELLPQLILHWMKTR